ncbi:MAG: class I SAM-dependent methyltransferase [Candidatus Omnitrophica bacterium]|nr:class I SAM-dependent methyltransferase [Candidatus Omnitrophota bacterium]
MKIDNNCCNICSFNEFELIKDKLRDDRVKYKVYKCKECSHVQLVPKPTAQEDKEFYDKNLQDKSRGKDIDYNKLVANNFFDTTRHVELIKQLCPDANCKILDIGTGYGFFVTELHNQGYKNILGIEPSIQRREIACKYSPAMVIDFDLDNPSKDIGKFNVITLFHVLEHMAEPIMFLRTIKKFMNPNGVFICEVPNENELLLDTCKSYNDFYWIRAHLNYFNEKTLLACFKKAEYDNVQIKYQQRYGLLNLCNWLIVGKPQIDCPVFEVDGEYKKTENFYKQQVESEGKSDALIAIARV